MHLQSWKKCFTLLHCQCPGNLTHAQFAKFTEIVLCSQEEDDRDHFERLQCEVMAESPSAVSFYNAHQKTVQRVGGASFSILLNL